MELNFKTDIKKWLDKLEPLAPEDAGLYPKLDRKKRVKAVVFDIYGTLLISSSGDIDQATFTGENMEQALVAGGFANENTNPDVYDFLLNDLPVKINSNQKESIANGHPFPDVDAFKVWNE
ncbi:MAG TPA: hypothetical protein VKA10_08595, partial [Prolixibacteraceae bacterium]|nr:hypothetical protein [Prolixibacteraceae bacterium]